MFCGQAVTDLVLAIEALQKWDQPDSLYWLVGRSFVSDASNFCHRCRYCLGIRPVIW